MTAKLAALAIVLAVLIPARVTAGPVTVSVHVLILTTEAVLAAAGLAYALRHGIARRLA